MKLIVNTEILPILAEYSAKDATSGEVYDHLMALGYDEHECLSTLQVFVICEKAVLETYRP